MCRIFPITRRWRRSIRWRTWRRACRARSGTRSRCLTASAPRRARSRKRRESPGAYATGLALFDVNAELKRLLLFEVDRRGLAEQHHVEPAADAEALLAAGHLAAVAVEDEGAGRLLSLERGPRHLEGKHAAGAAARRHVVHAMAVGKLVQRLLPAGVNPERLPGPVAQRPPVVSHRPHPVILRQHGPRRLEERRLGHLAPAILIQKRHHLDTEPALHIGPAHLKGS